VKRTLAHPARPGSILFAFAILSVFLFGFRSSVLAAVAKEERAPVFGGSVWRPMDESSIPAGFGERDIIPERYRTVRFDGGAFHSLVGGVPLEFTGEARTKATLLEIPRPDGGFEEFEIALSPIMEPELASQNPEIRTYSGQGIDDPSAALRFDWTPAGFHAMVLSPAGAWFVDPYRRGDTEHYISYFTRDFRKKGEPFVCGVSGEPIRRFEGSGGTLPEATSGTTLRKYRLAVGATAEYTAYQGGTVDLAFAAITTSINRVTGVYEQDFAIRLVLVASEKSIIYTNTNLDGYTNGSPGSLLSQNQSKCDNIIGSANYDIGHVFSTAGGGLAALGVICQNGSKAQGETGTSSPVGDPFDIDYVAHEMGHQFGGNHTFNGTTSNCGGGNRAASAAYEPGSASTIMGYAGICGAEDLQPHSDPYFHTKSFDEIVAYTTTGSGNGCPVKTATGNSPPAISAGPSFTIPKSTPFVLTASGSDPDGNPITYCWEEFDLGAAGPPDTDDGTRPIFRSFNPTASPSRTFPKMADVVSGTPVFGESLPVTNRTMTFRVTARDNRSGGGGVAYASTQVTISAAAGPFAVTSPNTAVTWTAGTTQTVTWNVAGTSSAPINCAAVRILLSTDGGFTAPIVVASSTPNDGSENIVVPGIPTSTARIRVEAAGNIFFDISNVNFTIACPAIPGEATSVLWTAASKSDLDWTALSGVSAYFVYRGAGADLPKLLDSSVDSCLRSSVSTNRATGLSEVAPGSGFYWYLVRGANACNQEGAAGNSSAGPEILNSSGNCP